MTANTLLNYVQPFSVILFVVASIIAFVAKKYHISAIDICVAVTNFVIFYGAKFIK